MTAPAWPVVRRCQCGRLRQEHYVSFPQADAERMRGIVTGTCDGYVEASVEERPPPSELRRRLEAVLAEHQPADGGLSCGTCVDERGANTAWPCPTVRAARGETA